MIRFGIVGAGKIASKFAKDIKFVEGAKAVAIASRDIDKANEFKNEHGLDYAFGSYEEMAKSNLIDAVYIATPHSFHMEQSILFMNHKKHVLCEKPIAVNINQFEKMVECAKDNNVLLMEAMWTKFLPATIKVREAIQSNRLGKFKHAYFEFGFIATGRGGDEGRLFNINLAGGSLLDLGIYPVAYTLNITDQKVKTLKANAKKYKTGIDLECTVDIVYEDDTTVTFVTSFLEELNKPGVIEFENGNIIVDDFWRSERVMIDNEVFEYPHLGEGFPYEIASFVKTLEKNVLENHLMTHDQTRRCLTLLDAIRKEIQLVYPFE